jgi:hypothetical protein
VPVDFYPSLAKGQPGLYVAHNDFGVAGTWGAEIRLGTVPADGPSGAQRIRFDVAEKPRSPAVGSAPPPTANKTAPATASANELAAITSDPAPDPSLYSMTVNEARETGLPTVVVFATPAFCQSKICGPIVDEIKDVKKRWDGRANFIHVEVYSSFDPLEVSPIMAAWGLSTEPWVFVLDREGLVADRLEGNVTAAELEPVLDRLAGS